MKKKKFERQQREKEAKQESKRQEFLNNLHTVTLNPIDDNAIEYERVYNWKCPNHDGSFSYSKKINDMWGHPHELVFCGVCCKYHKFVFAESV